MRFETRLIHAGVEPDPTTGAIMTPVYLTSTFVQDGVGRPRRGYEYSRTRNPTRAALEANLAALEGGTHGLAFASGMAAIDAVLRLLPPGAHVVVSNDVYGGTYRLFEQVYRPYGLTFTYVDTTQPDQVAQALREETRLIWLETPTNPLLRISDIQTIARIAQAHPARPWVAVDNTFATPYLQRPLELGADIVVHSTTKYLGGHSDVVGGTVVVKDAELYQRLAFLQNAVGAVPGPLDCFLVLRGIKTLAVRMDRHSVNAQAVAEFLARHPRVKRVHYPFLPEHPQHSLARKQMKAGGGMVSFEVDSPQEAIRVAESTRLFALAESLGGVESLIEVPAAMTHASTRGSTLEVPATLVRLSVGIEHVEDLIADLEQALNPAR